MTDLSSVLAKLGLIRYLEKFKEEGFETWETVLDITESDLCAFNCPKFPCSAQLTLVSATL